jgi:hypothetical protein
MPRGYGGTAILWRKGIDTIVTPLTIGNNRIQCIEITGDLNLLITSVYLPCKGSPNSQNEFQECIDPLHEIMLTYEQTCESTSRYTTTYHHNTWHPKTTWQHQPALNCSFKMFAFCVVSATSCPSFFKGATPLLSVLSNFMKEKSFFGFDWLLKLWSGSFVGRSRINFSI